MVQGTAVDSVMLGQMERRFEQSAMHLYDSMEEVLLNSFKGIRCEDSVVELICSHFGDDIDKPALIRQLECLQDARRSQTSEAVAEPNGELPLAVTIATEIACLRKFGQHRYYHVHQSRKTTIELLLLYCRSHQQRRRGASAD